MRRVLYLFLPDWPIDRLRRAGATPPLSPSASPAEEGPFATVLAAVGRRLLAAVNRSAADAGLAPGMPLADALSFLPGLATAAADPAADAAALTRLAEWCRRYSPWTAPDHQPDESDGIKIEITGCAHLWGGEAALAADLARRLARQDISHRIAIAGSLGAASGLARFAAAQERPALPPSGGEREALAPLPVAALRLDPATVQGLRRVGLKRIGELYPMPRDALARRFGETVAERLDQALDLLPEPLSPLGETPARRVRLSFAEPIADPADLARAAERLAADLAARLAREGMGARRLDLAFHRIDGRVEHIRLGTARPSRDPRHLAKLFAAKLDTVEVGGDPGLGVEDMILAAYAVEPLPPEQLESALPGSAARLLPRPAGEVATPDFSRGSRRGQQRHPLHHASHGPPPPQSGGGFQRDGDWVTNFIPEIAPLLDQIGARLGLDAISRLEARESHIPERASILLPAAEEQSSKGLHRQNSPSPPPNGPWRAERAGVRWGIPERPPKGPPHPAAAIAAATLSPPKGGEGFSSSGMENPSRPVRLFEPPEPVEAWWVVPDDPPFRFLWRRRDHIVARADGAERIAAEWWVAGASGGRADAVRDYYRVEDAEGRRFWLFRAGLADGGEPPRWFLHGIFA